jgi:starch phosphorylase
MQQHCIAMNGTFFNTHRMLRQYFTNAYFPQTMVSKGAASTILTPDAAKTAPASQPVLVQA